MMTKPIAPLSSGVAAAPAVLFLALAYLLVGYATLSPGLHLSGDDWAQYVNHACNLAFGRPYTDTGYVFNPAQPHVGPPSYSPGLPLLLAPIVRVFGINIIALKSAGLLCMAGAICLTFLLFRDALGAWVAAAGAALFALHDGSWNLHDYIASEPSYILWSLAALYFASRPLRGRGLSSGIACGLFAYAAFSARPIGAALTIATILYEIAQRRLFSWRFVCIAGIPAAGVVLQKHFFAVADYSGELHVLTLNVLASNFIAYWKQAAGLFPVGRHWPLSPFVVAPLTLLGIGYRLQRDPGRAAAASITARARDLLQRVPVDVWYLGVYCATLVALPFGQDARYLLPTLPIVCAYIAYALTRLLATSRYARPAAIAVCILCVCYYGGLHWLHDRRLPGDDALCADCRAMYSFLQNNTAASTTIAFAKPRALALLTGRRGWMWAQDRDQESNWDEMMQAHIDYIVLVAPAHPLASMYPFYLSWDAWRSNPRLSLVYQNRTFKVLRLQRHDA
jgi:hypothetical protein